MTSRPPPRTRRTRFRPSRRTSRNSMSERTAVKVENIQNQYITPYHSNIITTVPTLSITMNYTLEAAKCSTVLKTLWFITTCPIVIIKIWTLAALRIQFSSPPLFPGGPGMLSRTRWAPCDLLTTTSFSLTAVCIRRTFDWFLVQWEGHNEKQQHWRKYQIISRNSNWSLHLLRDNAGSMKFYLGLTSSVVTFLVTTHVYYFTLGLFFFFMSVLLSKEELHFFADSPL